MKLKHEIRDPIHGFVKVLSEERKILDSLPMQRLRYIHQLGLTFLLYPSATHKRFEHSLGVMELATRIYDVITSPYNIFPGVRDILPELNQNEKLIYWRKVVRMAGLCHDVGHLPFSHTVEKDLLPPGWNHERITACILESIMKKLFEENITPPLRIRDIIKIALGPEKIAEIYPDEEFTPWESILSEIITGDCFGADRMDHLLRDSYHIGVAYGKFDQFRLIDTLRILVDPESNSPELGVEIGGLHVVESLLLARYFMYSQVYLHPVRRIYDHHLKAFLKKCLEMENREFFPVDNVEEFLNYSDDKFLWELKEAFKSRAHPGWRWAEIILSRKHYRLVYELTHHDLRKNPQALEIIYHALLKKYGEEKIIKDDYEEEGGIIDFLVVDRQNNIRRAREVSDVLQKLPRLAVGYLFSEPPLKEEIDEFLKEEKDKLLQKEVSNGEI